MPTSSVTIFRRRLPSLCHDIQLYVSLSHRLFLAPTPFMVRFMGEDAADLADRRATDAATWGAFRTEVTMRHPAIPLWTSAVAEDGQILNSVVERVFYEAILRRKPSSMKVEAHPFLHPARKWRADFGITSLVQVEMRHIEVAGLIGSDGQPRNEREAGYQRHLEAKLGVYSQVGLPEPIVIYIDIVVDPIKLQDAIDRVLALTDGGVP